MHGRVPPQNSNAITAKGFTMQICDSVPMVCVAGHHTKSRRQNIDCWRETRSKESKVERVSIGLFGLSPKRGERNAFVLQPGRAWEFSDIASQRKLANMNEITRIVNRQTRMII